MTELNIVNTSGNRLAIDAKLGFKKPIKHVLATGASVDVGDVATLDELNQNPEIRALVTAGNIRIDVVAEADDLTTEGGVPDDLGIGMTHKIVITVPVGGGGAGDDTIIASMPWPAILVSAAMVVETAAAGSLTLRDTVGGAGTALSDAMSTASTGLVESTGINPLPALSRGDLITARHTDNTTLQEVIVELMRTA